MTIEPTPWFLRQVKRLSKKYPSITADIRALSTSLEKIPRKARNSSGVVSKLEWRLLLKIKEKVAEVG
jgi:hypothetical protein